VAQPSALLQALLSEWLCPVSYLRWPEMLLKSLRTYGICILAKTPTGFK